MAGADAAEDSGGDVEDSRGRCKGVEEGEAVDYRLGLARAGPKAGKGMLAGFRISEGFDLM